MVKLTITIDTKAKKGVVTKISRSGKPYEGENKEGISRIENAIAILYEKSVVEKQKEISQKSSNGEIASVLKEASDFYKVITSEDSDIYEKPAKKKASL